MGNDIQKLTNALDRLERNASNMDALSVPLLELFDGAFMGLHTEFDSLEAMLNYRHEGLPLEDVPSDEWEVVVREKTQFDSWDAMLETAGQRWLERHGGDLIAAQLFKGL